MIYLDEDIVINPDKIEWFEWVEKTLLIRFSNHTRSFDGKKAQLAWKVLEEWVRDGA